MGKIQPKARCSLRQIIMCFKLKESVGIFMEYIKVIKNANYSTKPSLL